MGRHKSIFVDRRKLLRSIAADITQAVAAVDRKISKQGFSTCYLDLERNHAFWPMQDLSAWAGRELTPSERLRHQEAIRKLEHDGLIERQTRYVTLTEAGWDKAGIAPPPAKYQPAARPAALPRRDSKTPVSAPVASLSLFSRR